MISVLLLNLPKSSLSVTNTIEFYLCRSGGPPDPSTLPYMQSHVLVSSEKSRNPNLQPHGQVQVCLSLSWQQCYHCPTEARPQGQIQHLPHLSLCCFSHFHGLTSFCFPLYPLASSLFMASAYSILCLSASALTLNETTSLWFEEEIWWVLVVPIQVKSFFQGMANQLICKWLWLGQLMIANQNFWLSICQSLYLCITWLIIEK